MSEKWKRYSYRYYHEGSWWSFELMARDWADAEGRAKKLNCQLDGEVIATIPASMGGGFLAPVITWIRNLFASP